jgi:hypothetical protein
MAFSRLGSRVSCALVAVALAAAGACGAGPSTGSGTSSAGSSGPSAAGEGPCAGLVQDRNAHPMPRLERPALRTAYVDPAFGGQVLRITDADPKDGANAVIRPMYSTIQAWNADESLLLLWHRKRGHQLYDGRTYEYRHDVDLESPRDIEQVYWDPADPDVLYYPSSYNAKPRLMRYRVSRRSNELVRDFRGAPTSCQASWDTLLSAGADPQDMSWGPEKVIGLRCGNVKFLYSISTDQVLAVTRDSSRTAPAAAYDGSLAYYEGNVLDRELKVVRSLDLANDSEHACLGRAASGPVFGAVDFDGSVPGSLVVHDMRTGAKKPIISTAGGWPYPPSGTHVSGVARSGPPGWFAVSVVGKPSGACVLCQELLLANVDTGTVCRVAHHRSQAGNGPWGYWAEPHVVISPRGTRLLFASDWGGGPTVDTYVVELRPYRASAAR